MSTAKKLGAPLELSPLDNPVARARRSLHLSQADFGRLIRATGQAVSQWETGVNKIPGPVELLCLLLLKRPDALDGLG